MTLGRVKVTQSEVYIPKIDINNGMPWLKLVLKIKKDKNFPVYSMTRYVIYSDRCLHGQQQWQMGIFRFTIRKEGNHILIKRKSEEKYSGIHSSFYLWKKNNKILVERFLNYYLIEI